MLLLHSVTRVHASVEGGLAPAALRWRHSRWWPTAECGSCREDINKADREVLFHPVHQRLAAK